MRQRDSLTAGAMMVRGIRAVQREERLQKFLTGLSGVEILTLDLNSAELAGRIYARKRASGCGQ